MKSALRKHPVAYTALLVLGALVIAYQLRMSLDTIRLETTVSFYVPAVIQPFTDRIDAPSRLIASEAGTPPDPEEPPPILRRGDQILSVNGRPFRGASFYLRELLYAEHARLPSDLDAFPFLLAVRSGDSTTRQIEVIFAHCTCGAPTALEAGSFWLAPPMFCVILGLATAWLRPASILAWSFLALTLSLSQLQYWPDWYNGFQRTATPMLWDYPSFRVLGVGYRALAQHAWPAAFVVASTDFYRDRRRTRRMALGIAAAFLVFAILQAALEIAWSENYLPLVPLDNALQHFRMELAAAAFAGVAVLTWTLSRGFGFLVTSISVLAAATLRWNPGSPLPHSHLVNAPALVMLLLAVFVVGAGLLAFKAYVTNLDALGFLLLAPPAYAIAGRVGLDVHPFGFVEFRYAALAGIGLLCIAWSVLKRPALGAVSEATGSPTRSSSAATSPLPR